MWQMAQSPGKVRWGTRGPQRLLQPLGGVMTEQSKVKNAQTPRSRTVAARGKALWRSTADERMAILTLGSKRFVLNNSLSIRKLQLGMAAVAAYLRMSSIQGEARLRLVIEGKLLPRDRGRMAAFAIRLSIFFNLSSVRVSMAC